MVKKVIYARLHASVFIPGVGSLKDTLPPDNKTIVLEMAYGDDDGITGLHITANGKKGIIPPGNVAYCQFAPESKPAPAPAKDDKKPA